MSFDTPRRYAAPNLDAPAPANNPHGDAEALLVELAEALRGLGEKATVRPTIGGPPTLEAAGAVSRMNEKVETGRRPDGTVFARFPWGHELPDDINEAAEVIRRVINPAA